MLRLVHEDDHLVAPLPVNFPFPAERAGVASGDELAETVLGDIGRSADEVLEALEHMSRRIDDLAGSSGAGDARGH